MTADLDARSTSNKASLQAVIGTDATGCNYSARLAAASTGTGSSILLEMAAGIAED